MAARRFSDVLEENIVGPGQELDDGMRSLDREMTMETNAYETHPAAEAARVGAGLQPLTDWCASARRAEVENTEFEEVVVPRRTGLVRRGASCRPNSLPKWVRRDELSGEFERRDINNYEGRTLADVDASHDKNNITMVRDGDAVDIGENNLKEGSRGKISNALSLNELEGVVTHDSGTRAGCCANTSRAGASSSIDNDST